MERRVWCIWCMDLHEIWNCFSDILKVASTFATYLVVIIQFKLNGLTNNCKEANGESSSVN
jgi:RsiW-degrading membrane proteinase PrsW (M82 family)